MQDVLSYIPSIRDLDFQDTNNGTNGARGDVAGVNMRGLGSQNTLVLLNGRRMVVHPTFQSINSVPSIFYNVNSIATSSVNRVEVLRDGAAPLYGADAIAGVVNFVTHEEYDGMRFTGKYGFADDTNYDEMEFTAAGGWRFNEGNSSISLFATYYDRSKVHMNELDDLYYDLDRRENPRIPEEWQGDSQLRNTSTVTPYARFRVGSLREDGVFIGSTRHINPTTGEICTGSGPARYNFNEDAWVTPSTERFNFMATFTHELDGGTEFFGDAFYYKAKSRTIRAASPLDDSLAFLIVPPGSYHNPYPDQEVLIIGWRPVDLGPPHHRRRSGQLPHHGWFPRKRQRLGLGNGIPVFRSRVHRHRGQPPGQVAVHRPVAGRWSGCAESLCRPGWKHPGGTGRNPGIVHRCAHVQAVAG